jgi:uncharacterized protein YjbJ (UPF0337 family)
MTTPSTSGSWKEIKAKLKQRYPNLTGEDLTFLNGKEEPAFGPAPEAAREVIRGTKATDTNPFKVFPSLARYRPAHVR